MSSARSATTPAAARQSAAEQPGPDASVGVDLKYAVTPALTLTGDRQSGLRPGRSRSGRGEPRARSKRSSTERRPFFIEGSGTYQFECRDCNLFYSRRIGRAPRGRADARRRRVRHAAAAVDDSRRRQADGTRRQLFGRRAWQRRRRRRTREIAFGDAPPPRSRRARHVLFRVARAARVRRSVVARVHPHDDQPATRGQRRRSCRSQAVTGGVDYDWRHRQAVGPERLLGGQHRAAARTEAIDQLQRSNVHSFQRPDAGSRRARSARRHAARPRRHGDLQQDRRRAHAHERQRRLPVARLRRQRSRVPAARRRDPAEQLVPGPMADAREVRPRNSSRQLQPVVGVQLRRRPPGTGRQRQRALGVPEPLGAGGGVNVNATELRRPADARRAGRFRPSAVKQLAVLQHERPQASSASTGIPRSVATAMGRAASSSSRASWSGPVSPFSTEVGVVLQQQINDAQWVAEVDRRRPDALRVRAARADDALDDAARQLHDDAEPVAAGLRRSRSCPPGATSATRSWSTAAPIATSDRYAPFAYDGNADFNVLSFRTTNVMRWEFRPGSTLFVVWQQGREGFGRPGRFRFGRDYADVFSTPSTNTLLVKLAYWLNP